jgi:hypothetical protein
VLLQEQSMRRLFFLRNIQGKFELHYLARVFFPKGVLGIVIAQFVLAPKAQGKWVHNWHNWE